MSNKQKGKAMYRYVFKGDNIDVAINSELEPEDVMKGIIVAHDDDTGFVFENQLFLSAGSIKNITVFVSET